MVTRWLIVITTCLVVAAGLGYYKYRQIQAGMAFAAAFPERVEAVEVFIAREEIWQPTTSVTAEVVAIQSIELSNELAGSIVEVGFAPGARVNKGQVLLRLDISEELAQIAAARAEAEIARLDLARNQKLITSGAAAQDARDRAKARSDAAVAAVNRVQAVIAKKTLRAPFDATTGLHELEVGQYLDEASVISRLIGINDRIWIDFTLPQQQAQLANGQRISATIVEAAQIFAAEIIARDAFVNEMSRNVRFRAIADNQELGLYAGTLVSVEVPVGESRIAVLVPVTAVRWSSFGSNVFVLRPAEEGAPAPERAEKRTVQLGPQRGEFVVITAGVRPGERIAADGAFKLREGMLVNAVKGDPGGISSAQGN
jgi:membrane fusion protein (multidrug efflux system)